MMDTVKIPTMKLFDIGRVIRSFKATYNRSKKRNPCLVSTFMKLANSLYCLPIYQDVFLASQLLAMSYNKTVRDIMTDETNTFIDSTGKLNLMLLSDTFRDADGKWLKFFPIFDFDG